MRDYKKMWDDRYSQDDFVYGQEPNQYFKSIIEKLEPGKLFMPGDGDGRNSIYAAKQNWDVTAVDFSSAAVEKSKQFAKQENVSIEIINADLSDYDYPQNYFDTVGLIFFHVQSPEKEIIHSSITKSIKPGGAIIIEVFSDNQLQHGSGGPRNKNALYSLEEIGKYYEGFNLIEFDEKTIDLNESQTHQGKASVIRLFGIKND